MNIVMVSTNDPAGTAISFMHAINRHTEHQCRLITTEIRYNFMFEKDLHLPWLKEFGEVEQVLRQADLFHFHMGADEDLPLGPFRVRDFLKDQPVIHHHHGEPAFRENPRRFADREKELGRKGIVSTPDLLRGYPEATWIPNIVPMNTDPYLPKKSVKSGDTIVVGHSPTKKELKNTAEFRCVMERISERKGEVTSRIIENTPHLECLSLKRDCDIFFDHMQGYFGVSSLEALSQGVPTIAGLDEWNIDHLRDFAGRDDLPWVIARDESELEGVVEDLISSSTLRMRIGNQSRRWMEECWGEGPIAEKLGQVYEGAR